MRIKKCIYEKLISGCPAVPPETGGILGGRDTVISEVFFDRASPQLTSAVYIPDVNYLNYQITQWHVQGIKFMGIFHSHPLYECELSGSDIAYITEIMKDIFESQPNRIYFPVVLPGHEVLGYYAELKNGKIAVDESKIILI